MKHVLVCIIVLASVAVLRAQDPKPADLVTVSGKVYKQARVIRVEPDGVHYMYAGGIVKIDFTDLPEAVRKQYGYDPEKARAFAKADAEEQGVAYQEAMRAKAEQTRRDNEVAAAAAKDIEAIPKTQSVGGNTLLDQAATSRIPVNGTVIQVTESGLLISHKDKVVLLQDYPKQNAVVEDAKCKAIGELKGSFEYDRADGTTGTVLRYHFISGTVINPRD